MSKRRGGAVWMRWSVLLGAGLMWGCQNPEPSPPMDTPEEAAATPAPSGTGAENTSPVEPLPPDSGPKPLPDPTPRLDARRPWWRAAYYGGTSPESLGVGDFDGDGAPDVVIGARGSGASGRYGSAGGSLRVLLNDGRGGLDNAPSALQLLYDSSGSLATGDVNADGRLDVLVGSLGQTQLVLGAGGGALLAQDPKQRLGWLTTTGAGVWTDREGAPLLWSLGVLEEIVHFYSAPRFYLAHLQTDGKPQQWEPLSAQVLREPEPSFTFSYDHPGLTAAVADFNEDGLPDVVFSHEQAVSGTKTQARVFLGEGSGQLVAGSSLAPLQYFHHLLSADFNRDGHLDLLALYADARAVGVLLGSGQGTFSPLPTVTLPHEVSGVAVVALDADGLPDVVALHGNEASVSLLRGLGGGRLESRGLLAVGRRPSAAASADLDGDGEPELLVVETDDNSVSVYQPPRVPQTDPVPLVSCPLNPGPGTPAPSAPAEPVVRLSLSDAKEGVAGDFDADGRMDLALTLAGGGMRLLLHEKDGQFATRELESVRGKYLSQPVAGDFDGDGRMDLAAVFAFNREGPTNGSRVHVLWNDTRDAFPLSEELTRWGTSHGLLAGDFNGDGLADVAMTPVDGGGGGASVAMSKGARQFRSTHLENYNHPPEDQRTYTRLPLAAADFNGDGTRDLVHLSSWGLNLNPTAKQGATLSGLGFGYWNTEQSLLAAADADGDGVADVILDSSSPAEPVLFWRGDGFGSLQAPMQCALPRGKQLLAWTDVNADGLADAVALEDNGRGVTVWVMLRAPGGKWGTVRPHALDEAPAWVLPVDLRGDARPELAMHTKTGGLLVFPPMDP